MKHLSNLEVAGKISAPSIDLDGQDLQGKLDAKSDTGHHHDGRYYTENEIDAKLDQVAHLSDEVSANIDTAGWYTIAEASTARGYGEFFIYDSDGGDHNIAKVIASTSYGKNDLNVLLGNRYGGPPAFDHVRILYNTADRTYGGAKLQVHAAHAAFPLRARVSLDQINNWENWYIQTPVLEDAPTGWAEDVRVENITDGGIRTAGDLVAQGTAKAQKLELAPSYSLDAADSSIRVNTASGYVDIGPKNTSYVHFQTDRPKFHFNQDTHVDGEIYAGANYSQKVWHEGNLDPDAEHERLREYVQSRMENLVTNGTGLLEDNTNFSEFTFDPSESYSGGGSFYTDTQQGHKNTDELVPVNPEKRYKVSAAFKGNPAVGQRHYIGIEEFDSDELSIHPTHVLEANPGSRTTLAQDLAPGDTVVHLTDSTDWVDHYGAGSHYHSIRVYPYTNAGGYTYPDYGYSRHVKRNAWDDAAIDRTAHTVTLNSAWDVSNPARQDGVWPAGTPVVNAQSGGTYKYTTVVNGLVPAEWETAKGYIGPGADNNDTSKFRPGTAFLKVMFLTNRNVTGGATNYDAISVSRVLTDVDLDIEALNDYLPLTGGVVTGSVTADSLSVGSNAVWHAGNFDPTTKAAASHNHDASDITSGVLGYGRVHGMAFVDTRSVVDAPADIPDHRLSAEFKYNSSVGSPPVTSNGSYSHILNIAGWDTDAGSGGWPSQVSVGPDGLAVRTAADAATWGTWKRLWHDGDFDPANKSDVGHGHEITDVSGLQTALDGKSSTGHTHDGRYYTESEIDTFLSGKAGLGNSVNFSQVDLMHNDVSAGSVYAGGVILTGSVDRNHLLLTAESAAEGTNALRISTDGTLRLNRTLADGTYTSRLVVLDDDPRLSGSDGPLGAENDAVLSSDYTIGTGKNLVTGGPIEVADGVSVTVPDGSTWTVV